MNNIPPTFSDKELYLIEYCASHLTGSGVFEEGFTCEELNALHWKCKEFRMGFRRCKACDCFTGVKDLSDFQICKSCQFELRKTCKHPVYMSSLCTTCGEGIWNRK